MVQVRVCAWVRADLSADLSACPPPLGLSQHQLCSPAALEIPAMGKVLRGKKCRSLLGQTLQARECMQRYSGYDSN